MKVKRPHEWDVTTAEAREIQLSLAGSVARSGNRLMPRLVAGIDCSVNKANGIGTGAAVVVTYPGLDLVEAQVVTGKLKFPYVPGLLSFREAPLSLEACEKLKVTPDLFLVDGQGLAHPRRMGIAAHLGLFLDAPTIGCAKSLLCGEFGSLGRDRGGYSPIVYENDVVGAALRTQDDTSPVFVSIGHKIDLTSAMHWVLACCRGYRLPEPARFAHLAATGNLHWKETPAVGGDHA